MVESRSDSRASCGSAAASMRAVSWSSVEGRATERGPGPCAGSLLLLFAQRGAQGNACPAQD